VTGTADALGLVQEVAMMPVVHTKACSLARNTGLKETCPESSACAFWETAPTDGGGRCGIERLGLDHLGTSVCAFLLTRRGLPASDAELPGWPHLPGF
jgi:hypothetical protein